MGVILWRRGLIHGLCCWHGRRLEDRLQFWAIVPVGAIAPVSSVVRVSAVVRVPSSAVRIVPSVRVGSAVMSILAPLSLVLDPFPFLLVLLMLVDQIASGYNF